uniref:Uncharacterized protein n=1 Tax=Strigamia maritima TaxID=126957 RepID=T1JJA8_STRMM
MALLCVTGKKFAPISAGPNECGEAHCTRRGLLLLPRDVRTRTRKLYFRSRKIFILIKKAEYINNAAFSFVNNGTHIFRLGSTILYHFVRETPIEIPSFLG